MFLRPLASPLRTLTSGPISRSHFRRLAQLNPHLIHRTMASASVPIPKTMKGVIIEKTGGVEVLQYRTDLPVPEPKEGEVLVKNDFIGVNYIDTYFRSGIYAVEKPAILGREAEGTIVAMGPSAASAKYYNLKEGDHVVWIKTSAYAEYSAAPAISVHVIPDGLEPGHAAASLLQGLTALTMIRESYAVQPGDWILVHAAAGGVGLWLCQLLKSVGARVIGTTSSGGKGELAREYGAEFVINSKTENVVERVLDLTGGLGVAAVFDGIGKATFEDDLKLLARRGSLVSFGNASGVVPPVTLAALSPKNLKLVRPVVFNYLETREEFEHYVGELFQFIIRDKLRVRLHEVYPLAEIARAHTDLEGRKTTGKLLLRP